MKRNILLTMLLLMCSLDVLAEQSFQIKFYTKNEDQPKLINIQNIEKIGFKNLSESYVMKFYYLDSLSAYYPVKSIDTIKFEIDTNNIKLISAYIFGTPHSFPIAEIDSVVFSEIETTYFDDVIVIDSTNNDDIRTIDSTSIVLDSNSTYGKNLKEGDILAGEPTENAPYGFLKRVKSIKTEGDSIIVEIEDAKITDVIKNGIFSFEIEFKPSDTLQSSYRKDYEEFQADEGFTLSFEDLVIEDIIKISGSNTFKPKLGVNLAIEKGEIKQFLIQFSVKNKLNLTAGSNSEIEKEFQKSLNQLLGISAFKLPPIVIGLIKISSNIDVQIGLKLKLAAEIKTSIFLENSSIGGIEYNSGVWKKYSENSSYFEFSPPDLSLGGSIKAFVGPQINISFFNLQDAFNAYINVLGFSELDVDLLNKPLWQLSAGLEANAGVKSEWWDELDYELPFVLEYRTLLAQATDLISTVTPSEAKVGDEITILGSGFGNTRGSSYVRFKFGNSMLPNDAIQATEYTSWSDEEIIVKVPNGLNPGDIKLLINVGGFFSNQSDLKIFSLCNDGNVIIGTQTWMCTNLDVTHYRNGELIKHAITDEEWVDAGNKGEGAWCYSDNDPANGVIYGKLYNWYAVNDQRGIAPEGWHVPSDEEWKFLEIHLGMSQEDADELGERGSTEGAKLAGFYDLWQNGALRNHYEFGKSGFSGNPGGDRDDMGYFSSIGNNSFWWSSSEYSSTSAIYRCLHKSFAGVFRSHPPKSYGFTIRCVKDEEPEIETVTLGSQVWTKNNLAVTHYRNGDSIPQVTDPTQWSNLTTGAWCYYHNDPANGAIYGKLYNWYAVNDQRGLAPEGWHVPSDDEWKILEMHLGMSQQEADIWGWRGSPIGAKLAGFYDLWVNGTLRNHSEFGKSGFSGSPVGYRYNDGYFSDSGNAGSVWWSASDYSSSDALFRGLLYSSTYVYRRDHSKRSGFSVRCVRD